MLAAAGYVDQIAKSITHNEPILLIPVNPVILSGRILSIPVNPVILSIRKSCNPVYP